MEEAVWMTKAYSCNGAEVFAFRGSTWKVVVGYWEVETPSPGCEVLYRNHDVG